MAASGIDIVAFFAADGCANSGGEESSAEEVDGVFGGSFVGEAFNFVVGDEVDLGVESFGVLGEKAGLFGTIVDACEKNVFEEDKFFTSGDKGIAGGEEAFHGITFIDGHDLIADLIAGGVKGEGEAEGEGVVSEFFDLGSEPAGGDGDVARAHADVGWGDEEIEGREEIGEIGERFAHAHEDKIVGSASSDPGGFENLADDFGGGEISAPAIESAGAEAATVGTTNLAGDADGESGTARAGFAEGGGDENGFDERSIAKFPEKLSGGVLGALDGDGFGGTE